MTSSSSSLPAPFLGPNDWWSSDLGTEPCENFELVDEPLPKDYAAASVKLRTFFFFTSGAQSLISYV
jgi:hypothetical protein